MQRGNLDDLLAFLAVARERSFTRAAAKLGISQSSLSHIIRELEARLGVRLLTRTTRSVAPTQAGDRLLRNIAPRFEEIDAELAAVRDLRDKPAGTIRITATDYAADAVLLPRLAKLLPDYPDIKVEIVVDYGLSDIVAEGYDAGVRSGEQVAKDMIAVRIGPDLRMAVVGAPSYFRKHPAPGKPQDLVSHNCINLRLPSHGGVYAWEFEKARRAFGNSGWTDGANVETVSLESCGHFHGAGVFTDEDRNDGRAFARDGETHINKQTAQVRREFEQPRATFRLAFDDVERGIERGGDGGRRRSGEDERAGALDQIIDRVGRSAHKRTGGAEGLAHRIDGQEDR